MACRYVAFRVKRFQSVDYWQMYDHGGKGSCAGLMPQKKKIASLNQINLILALRKE